MFVELQRNATRDDIWVIDVHSGNPWVIDVHSGNPKRIRVRS